MLHGLAALDGDPGTDVIVLVSKPPALAVAAKGPGRGRRPVVGDLPGPTRPRSTARGVQGAVDPGGRWRSRWPAATPAVTMSRSRMRSETVARQGQPTEPTHSMCGGYAAPSVLRPSWCTAPPASPAHSNTPVDGNTALLPISPPASRTPSSTAMGDDEFTQGRPHPMIDRCGTARIRAPGRRPGHRRRGALRRRARLRVGGRSDRRTVAGADRGARYARGVHRLRVRRTDLIRRTVRWWPAWNPPACWSHPVTPKRPSVGHPDAPTSRSHRVKSLPPGTTAGYRAADNITAAGGSATQLDWAPRAPSPNSAGHWPP